MAASVPARQEPQSPAGGSGSDVLQSRDRAREGRSELMQRVTEFVLKHDVALTGSNLSLLVAALSGSDSALARAFTAREISQEPFSQKWLDEMARSRSREEERKGSIEQLIDRVEASLTKFAQTAQTAEAETSEHRGAIDAHIATLAQNAVQDGSQLGIERLVDLSRVMLERIVQIEEAMKKSQAETADLKESLAEARAEANVDHLTNLPNRRAFETQLEKLSERAAERGEPLSVGFCDVDHFKSINDTHGHDAGDRVLVAIARTLQSYAGRNCFAARHGGEEFALLFPGADIAKAKVRLDKIRMDLSSRQMVNRDNGQSFGKITFSGGVSQIEGPEDARNALARADAALYKAKESGRDQVIAG
ncbi:GGDEF domain-containing protein [Erythrobacter sp. SCSIO 43205]|uniref:GGDEF domain-containing protein n=1 Tax=Erythrobacter sp. SCSIO 43205 TaxID=2779361 RepID=UPI001CA9C28C|nr:GGDEF domain-containing protein [Erythrobacter sp. SCSIO 43205]UAB78718.1 GGDEF domain-containing protein [Erythrobacter sp. SCSIO 43205]